ncbi:hypothetical protein AB4501_32425, partial [Vibrio sp. 10N.222.55.E8]
EQDALHDLFSNPNRFSHIDEFPDSEGSELASSVHSDELLNSRSEPKSEPTRVQDNPLEGLDDFDETALAELLAEDVQSSVDNMFNKPLDETSIASAGLDIDAMLE